MRANGRCAVCQHSERHRIELLLAGGASKRSVAEKFSLHPDSVWRHFTHHVTDERKAALIAGPVKLHELAERAASEGLSILDYLNLIRTSLLSQFAAASSAGDRHGAASLAGRLLETLREIGRFTGEIAKVGAVHVVQNFYTDPRFTELQATLIRTLARHPEARGDVISAFRQLEVDAASRAPVIDATPQVTDAAA